MLNRIILLGFIALVLISVAFALKSDRDYTTSSKEAYELFLEGQDLQSKLYNDEAYEKYKQAHKLDSNFAMVLLALGDMSYNYGERDKAITYFEKAKNQYDKLKKHEQLIVDGAEYLYTNQTDKAVKIFHEYVKAFPKRKEGHAFLAAQYWSKGEVDSAINEYEKIMEIEPDYAPIYNALGYLEFGRSNFDKALKYFEEYLEILPNQANPHDSKGEILMAMGSYDEAVYEFKTAHQIEPRFKFVLYHLAQAYEFKGMFIKADKTYDKLERMISESYESYNLTKERARSYWHRGDLESARKIGNSFIANARQKDGKVEHADIFWGNIITGFSYIDAEIELAKKHYQTALDAYQNISTSRSEESLLEHTSWLTTFEALISLKEENFENALKIQELVNNKMFWRPDLMLDAKTILAVAYFHLDQKESAYKLLNDNLKVNSNNLSTLVTFADFYELEGRIADAIETLQYVLDLYKDADEKFLRKERIRNKLAELSELASNQ